MYEFRYDQIKPKCLNDAKLCYMDTDSFITHIKTDNFYEDIADNAEERFYTSNHEVNRPSLRGKDK